MFCVLNCRNASNIYMKKLITIALIILPLFLSAQNDSVISNIYKRAGYDELYSELYKKDNWKKYFESKGMYKIDNSIYAQIDTIYHIFRFRIKHDGPLPQEKFLDGSFTEYLSHHWNSQPIEMILPCDSTGILLKNTWFRPRFSNKTYLDYMSDLLQKEYVDCIMFISTIYDEECKCVVDNGDWCFGFKNDKIYVILPVDKCIPIEEFMEYGYDYITSLSKEMPEELQKIYEEANDKGYNDANNDYLHIWFNQ